MIHGYKQEPKEINFSGLQQSTSCFHLSSIDKQSQCYRGNPDFLKMQVPWFKLVKCISCPGYMLPR